MSSPKDTKALVPAEAERAAAKVIARALRHRAEQIKDGSMGSVQTETPNQIANRALTDALPAFEKHFAEHLKEVERQREEWQGKEIGCRDSLKAAEARAEKAEAALAEREQQVRRAVEAEVKHLRSRARTLDEFRQDEANSREERHQAEGARGACNTAAQWLEALVADHFIDDARLLYKLGGRFNRAPALTQPEADPEVPEAFAEIDAEDFERAKEHPGINRFAGAADAHVAQLCAEGRIEADPEVPRCENPLQIAQRIRRETERACGGEFSSQDRLAVETAVADAVRENFCPCGKQIERGTFMCPSCIEHAEAD